MMSGSAGNSGLKMRSLSEKNALMLHWVAWCSRVSQYALVLGEVLRARRDRFECFSRRHWRSFSSHLAGQVFMRQRKVLSRFSICEPVVVVISIVLEVNLTSPLVMGQHTADIKQLVWQRLFLWDFTPENVREKSWLALFQWTNHQIEV